VISEHDKNNYMYWTTLLRHGGIRSAIDAQRHIHHRQVISCHKE